MTPPSTRPDIAIVGGGPAGLALAAICQQRGFSYIVYERSARDTPPRGGCLDLHAGSGQRAMKEAGVFDLFKKHSRGGDDSTVHKIYNHLGEHIHAWGHSRDSPEIDRDDIKRVLLSAIPEEKIVWRKKLDRAERNAKGKIELRFEDGSVESDFKLVVGADGTFSKVRPLITPVDPKAWGTLFMETSVSTTNPYWQNLRDNVGLGPWMIMGRKTGTWVQIQGRGHYNCGFGIVRSPEWAQSLDLEDVAGIKKLLLSDEFFGQHAQKFKDILINADAPFRPWPLYQMPTEALNWEPSSDVVLIGDSAHTTTPFIGDGANCAMRDACILAEKIGEFGFGKEANGAYEREMFGFAKTMIQMSDYSGGMFFAEDAPKDFVHAMKTTPFVGLTDDQ